MFSGEGKIEVFFSLPPGFTEVTSFIVMSVIIAINMSQGVGFDVMSGPEICLFRNVYQREPSSVCITRLDKLCTSPLYIT